MYLRISAAFLGLALLIAVFGCGGGGGGTAPTVSSTSASGRVFTTQSVTVTFSEEMDQTSVEGAFAVFGSDAVDGSFAWDGNTVAFTPTSLWKTHHEYTLTIGIDAKSSSGTYLQEEFTQAFTPELNMHDVNGDGIDDFMVGAPLVDYSQTSTDSGEAYLILGSQDFGDIDLATQSADAVFNIADNGVQFGYNARVVGDINGDGYADFGINAPCTASFAVIKFGSASPQSIFIDSNDPPSVDSYDALVLGGISGYWVGFPIVPAGDVNGDGLADVLLGSKDKNLDLTRFWLVLGRTDSFPLPSSLTLIDSVADAVFTVSGVAALAAAPGFPGAACDINGDEYDDIVLGSPTGDAAERGRVYVVAGSASPVSVNLAVAQPSETISGAADGDRLGAFVACADVNGDGYGDIVAGSSSNAGAVGRTYLITGAAEFADLDLSSQDPAATYTGVAAADLFGVSGCAAGDVNDDGYQDVMVGGPLVEVGGVAQAGTVYLFLGSETPSSVDLATQSASATFTAKAEGGWLGYCKCIGDVNGDGIDDMLMGAPAASGGGANRGEAYVVFGSQTPASIDLQSQSPDASIYGKEDGDMLMVAPGFF